MSYLFIATHPLGCTGPFEVKSTINPSAVLLKLPKSLCSHPTFHVSHFKSIACSTLWSDKTTSHLVLIQIIMFGRNQLQPNNMVTQVKMVSFLPSIMLVVASCSGGTEKLVAITGKMDGAKYKQIVENHLSKIDVYI